MPNRPLLRSRLVAALAKRTLLASSSACFRSSTVRSGALLNINKLVYIPESAPANPPHTDLARRILRATRWGDKPMSGRGFFEWIGVEEADRYLLFENQRPAI